MLQQLAAAVAAILFVGLALFHAALAFGAPLGAYAWGGLHKGVLPARLQVGSAISVPLMLAMALMVLVRAGLIYQAMQGAMSWAVWAVFLFLVMSTVASFRASSREERRAMAPRALSLAVLVGYLAISLG